MLASRGDGADSKAGAAAEPAAPPSASAADGSPQAQPGRADARRNRDRVLAVARRAFQSASGRRPISLEGIAREAGVGIGTLYRHFPTRQTLVEAVYGAELDALAEAADALLAGHPADRGLRIWMDRYAQFIRTKRGMLDALQESLSGGRLPSTGSRDLVRGVLERFLAAGADHGTLRGDVSAEDVTVALVGVFLASGMGAPHAQVDRLLDLLLAGLRPGR